MGSQTREELVHTARVETAIGELRLASTAAGLAFLELPHSNGQGFAGWLRRWAPGARVDQGFAPNRSAMSAAIRAALWEGSEPSMATRIRFMASPPVVILVRSRGMPQASTRRAPSRPGGKGIRAAAARWRTP